MKHNSKAERYQFMQKTSPKMVETIAEIQEAFGAVLLSGVGPANEPVKVKPVLRNIWK